MKKRMLAWVVVAVAGVHPAVQGQTPKGADALIETARKRELLSGDLEGAIRAYKEVLAKHGRNRAAAATALVRMGQCYEKLGSAEARKSYERAVREFGDQNDVVATARVRLAALSAASPSGDGMQLRRLDSGARFELVKGVTSDGRFIGFSYAEAGGSQGIYDTVTKQEKLLVNLDWKGDTYGGTPLLSRDGKWLVFATYKNRAQDAELRVVRADGTGMRTIHKLTGSSWVIPKDWTPDQRQVLVQISSKGTTHLSLVNIADGAVKQLMQVASSDHHAYVSPDGPSVPTWLRHRPDPQLLTN